MARTPPPSSKISAPFVLLSRGSHNNSHVSSHNNFRLESDATTAARTTSEDRTRRNRREKKCGIVRTPPPTAVERRADPPDRRWSAARIGILPALRVERGVLR
jgi:hypothetical protein